MNNTSSEFINDDDYHVHLAQNLISACSTNGLQYSLIKDVFDNSFNKIADILISILHNNLDDQSFQNEIKTIKIIPFRRLAEEIISYKKNTISLISKYSDIDDESKMYSFQEQEEKLQLIQDSILMAAKQSNSPKIKSCLQSIDLDESEISKDDLNEILLILIQEGKDITQIKMANLWEQVFKTFDNNGKVDKTIPAEQSETLILQTIQSIKKKVNNFTKKSLQTNMMQTQLIETLELQIEDLKKSLHYQNEAELFESDFRKRFEEFENSENKKFDKLFENYRVAFKKIEEVTKSKNELLLRNGSLETQNLLLQQKVTASLNENNKLKQTIQNFQLKNRKSH